VYKRQFLLFAALVLLPAFGLSKQKETPFFISFGADANANLYFADFKQFEGVNNCCTNFGNTFGLGYNVHAGFEYLFDSELFGMPWKLDLSLAYTNLSATFTEEYEIANIITGDTYTKAVSEFVLEPSIYAVIFDPGIFFDPIENLPLSIRAGFQVGFLIDKTFTQQEQLVSPPDVYFENGTRVRGQYSGDIPNASSQYFALSIGARYKAAEFGNFALYPSLRFNYGLNNIVEGIDWKISALQGGLSLVYNFPKGEYPPPPAPPAPPLPSPAVPPKKSQLVLGLSVEHNGSTVGNSIEMPYIRYESQLEYYLLPYIFFDANSDIPLTEGRGNNNNIGEASAQSELIKASVELLKANPQLNVTLLASSLSTEKQEVIDSRISKITNEITSYNIPINKIKVEQRVVNPDDFEIDELLNENVFIKLNMSDGSDLIYHSISQTIKKEVINSHILRIKPDIATSHSVTYFEGKINHNNNLLKSFNDLGVDFDITSEPALITNDLAPSQIRIEAVAKNSGGSTETTEKTISISFAEERRISEQNVITSNDSEYSQYVLCYFDFDKFEPKTINKNVLEIVQNALNNDKEVALLALTDNIGTEKYNYSLADKRANAALKLIGVNSEKLLTSKPKSYIFDNDTPIGRMLNRTVVVRIKNK